MLEAIILMASGGPEALGAGTHTLMDISSMRQLLTRTLWAATLVKTASLNRARTKFTSRSVQFVMGAT
jgi:hypothetical protein